MKHFLLFNFMFIFIIFIIHTIHLFSVKDEIGMFILSFIFLCLSSQLLFHSCIIMTFDTNILFFTHK